MLFNTFAHIPSIGTTAEERLWDSGARDWDSFAEPHKFTISKKKIDFIKGYLQESKGHIENNNPSYFESALKSSLHWRFFPEFRKSSVYLDIETNGLDSYCDSITTIAL